MSRRVRRGKENKHINLLYEIIYELDKVFFDRNKYKLSNIDADNINDFYLLGIKIDNLNRDSDGTVLGRNYSYTFCKRDNNLTGYNKVEAPIYFVDLHDDMKKMVKRLDSLLQKATLLAYNNPAKVEEDGLIRQSPEFDLNVQIYDLVFGFGEKNSEFNLEKALSFMELDREYFVYIEKRDLDKNLQISNNLTTDNNKNNKNKFKV